MAVPPSPVVPLDPAVDTAFAGFPFNFDPQVLGEPSTIAPNCYFFENATHTSGYSLNHGTLHKRRRLSGFNLMSSADEFSSSSIVYQEKPPIADHDSALITPRWVAPVVSNVPSIGSPFARVAESICCNFGWQQPAGMQAALPPLCSSFFFFTTVED